ncbi:MAG: hypothetical protein CMG64_02510 [Candidatus Marinimicrobia bacterium]|nr:hypothetical protein [Candidatus Neomarinimicrobiota bacterium]|tara:strand:+ start:17928 stop:18620 length:693 start_codon:yes stop_codon:yes gene_type:complete
MENKLFADRLYLILSSIFIASLVSCNLIFQKFFEMNIYVPFLGQYTFEQSVGLLPYPVTFIVTDIISEIYGRKKANQVVTSGLFASLFMLLIVTISDMVSATSWSPVDDSTFSKVFGLSGAAVFASMIAYLVAQYIDVRVFHFWKNLTRGKHLWLRNNASTIFSQFVDTFSVLFLLCFLDVLAWDRFSVLLINGFLFKVFFAAFDTPIIYVIIYFIRRKFNLEFGQELKH